MRLRKLDGVYMTLPSYTASTLPPEISLEHHFQRNIPVGEASGSKSEASSSNLHFLARRRTQKRLALGQDRHLEGRHRGVPRRAPGLDLAADGARRVLERLEAGEQNMGEDQQALGPIIVLAEAAEDAGGDELAQRGTREVGVLPASEVRLVLEELGPVGEQAVDFWRGSACISDDLCLGMRHVPLGRWQLTD